MSIETKICSRCKTKKPLSDFNRDKKRKDGFQTYCRECMKEMYPRTLVVNKEKEENRKRLSDYKKGILKRNGKFKMDCRPIEFRAKYRRVMRHSPTIESVSDFEENTTQCDENCYYWDICNNK